MTEFLWSQFAYVNLIYLQSWIDEFLQLEAIWSLKIKQSESIGEVGSIVNSVQPGVRGHIGKGELLKSNNVFAFMVTQGKLPSKTWYFTPQIMATAQEIERQLNRLFIPDVDGVSKSHCVNWKMSFKVKLTIFILGGRLSLTEPSLVKNSNSGNVCKQCFQPCITIFLLPHFA